jgi:DNA-directed RNA polymerase specialized sigma24 family protein
VGGNAILIFMTQNHAGPLGFLSGPATALLEGVDVTAPDLARLAELEAAFARLEENRRRAVEAARARAARVREAIRWELAAPDPPPYREIARRCGCSVRTVTREAKR